MALTAREREVLEAGLARIKGGTMSVNVICADEETLKDVQALLKGKRGMGQVTPVLNTEPGLACFGARSRVSAGKYGNRGCAHERQGERQHCGADERLVGKERDSQ